MAHLNCIMFLSPDAETLEWVKEELAKPKYGGYWLCKSRLSGRSLCAVGRPHWLTSTVAASSPPEQTFRMC